MMTNTKLLWNVGKSPEFKLKSHMINFKQEELIEGLMDQLKQRFPEVVLIDVVEGPEDPETLWIRVMSPEDEDREIELMEFSGDLVTDICRIPGGRCGIGPPRHP
jgi:hypothetical protein